MDSLPVLAATTAAFLLAGVVKGVIGLGLPTVAIGLLGLVMAPAQAAAILVVPSLVTNIWQAAVGGGVSELAKRLWSLLLGICIGTFIGVVWLPSGSSKEATAFLGMILALYACLGLFKVRFSVPPQSEDWLGLVMGIATGAITVATGVLAVPMVPYIQSLTLERDRLVQALGLTFTVSTVTLALALSHAGEVRASLLTASIAALVAAPAGMVIGQIVRRHVRPETFRLFFLVGLLALGLHLALRGLL